jgi:hypothetical protein
MKIRPQRNKWLSKKSKGFHGYPVGTIAFYGPDNARASKVAVGVLAGENSEPVAIQRWFSETGDVRYLREIGEEIADFLQGHGVRSVAMSDRIIGCPHEEGIDYALGETCPRCPYWADRDRWSTPPG